MKKIFSVILGPFSAIFWLKMASKSTMVKNGKKNLKKSQKILKIDNFIKIVKIKIL